MSVLLENIVSALMENDLRAGSQRPELSYYQKIVELAKDGKRHPSLKEIKITTHQILEWWSNVGRGLERTLQDDTIKVQL